MSDTPQARSLIDGLLHRVNAMQDELDTVRDTLKMVDRLLCREPATRRAPRQNFLVVTDELAADVIEFVNAHPEMTYHDIATHFGLGRSGSVSEIVTGQR